MDSSIGNSPTQDESAYLVGTNDGLIHRCSAAYNEQYLQTFHGHAGAVWKTRCNPYYPSIFLSAGADWSMKLWS